MQLPCPARHVEHTAKIDTKPVIVDIKTASARPYGHAAAVQTLRSSPGRPIEAVRG